MHEASAATRFIRSPLSDARLRHRGALVRHEPMTLMQAHHLDAAPLSAEAAGRATVRVQLRTSNAINHSAACCNASWQQLLLCLVLCSSPMLSAAARCCMILAQIVEYPCDSIV
jgi:hypothetical protein